MELRKYPNPILKEKSEEVKEITPEIKNLVQEMMVLMEKEKGVGLAAPQVGVLKKVIVMETGNGVTALINPKIIEKSKESFKDMEGCLSFPDLWVKVNRPKKAIVETLTLEGNKVKIEAEWMAARILQHEIDHLEGALLYDRMSFFDKWKARKKLRKMKKDYESSGRAD